MRPICYQVELKAEESVPAVAKIASFGRLFSAAMMIPGTVAGFALKRKTTWKVVVVVVEASQQDAG